MRLRSMESRHDSPVSAVCVVPSGVKCNPSILTISNVSSEVRKLTNLDDSVVYEPWQITSISLSSSLWVQESTFTFRRKCPNSQAEKQLWASMHFVCNFLEMNWQTWHATKKKQLRSRISPSFVSWWKPLPQFIFTRLFWSWLAIEWQNRPTAGSSSFYFPSVSSQGSLKRDHDFFLVDEWEADGDCSSFYHSLWSS